MKSNPSIVVSGRYNEHTLAMAISATRKIGLPEPRSLSEAVRSMMTIGISSVLGANWIHKSADLDDLNLIRSLTSQGRKLQGFSPDQITKAYLQSKNASDDPIDPLLQALRTQDINAIIQNLPTELQPIAENSMNLILEGSIALQDQLLGDTPLPVKEATAMVIANSDLRPDILPKEVNEIINKLLKG